MPRLEFPDPVQAKIGERIRAIRTQKGVSLNALQGKVGLHKAAISGMERGLIRGAAVKLVRIAAGLGVDLLYLLAFDEESELARLVRLAGELPPETLRALIKQWPAVVELPAGPPGGQESACAAEREADPINSAPPSPVRSDPTDVAGN